MPRRRPPESDRSANEGANVAGRVAAVILVGKLSGAIALTLAPGGAHCLDHNCALTGGIGECRRTLVYQLYLDRGAAIVT